MAGICPRCVRLARIKHLMIHILILINKTLCIRLSLYYLNVNTTLQVLIKPKKIILPID